MSKPLVSDALWESIKPLLPPEPPKPKGGRPRVPARAALTGILFVLKSGIPWEMLPQEMGCGSGMTCWRRLRDWQSAGIWPAFHHLLLKLHADKAFDLPRCRTALRRRSITPRIARRGIESRERLGRHRWVVERTLSWIARYRRLTVRYERRADIHLGFLVLACALICFRFLQRFC